MYINLCIEKKEYITDNTKESVALLGSQPERFGKILMSAVVVLAMLISNVQQKAKDCLQNSMIQCRYNRRCQLKNLSYNHLKIKHRPNQSYLPTLSCLPKQPLIISYLRFAMSLNNRMHFSLRLINDMMLCNLSVTT